MKVLAVSSTRADWGLLCPVITALGKSDRIDVNVVFTGQHILNMESINEMIAVCGVKTYDVVDIGLNYDDSSKAVGRAMGAALAGMADIVAKRRPDLVLVLGDRYEILAVVAAASVSRIPVAHIAGGDITEGAFDDGFRHAITKLSSLHFVTNEDAKRRVLQMGEQPSRVILSGSPGIDTIVSTRRLSRPDFLLSVGLPSTAETIFLVTFHPVTLRSDSKYQCDEMLRALEDFSDTWVIVTGPNADPEGRQIELRLQDWVRDRTRAVFHQNLGTTRYLSALEHCNVVVGNSSSGLYEAPSFGIPSVNIGERQAGRPRALSVIDCEPKSYEIVTAIRAALRTGRQLDVENPYGNGGSSEKIVRELELIRRPQDLLKKSFVDIQGAPKLTWL